MSELNPQMAGRDVFVRTTSPSGSTSLSAHRCWGGEEGVERFMAARRADALKQNEEFEREHPKAVPKAWAEQITADQYRNERKA